MNIIGNMYLMHLIFFWKRKRGNLGGGGNQLGSDRVSEDVTMWRDSMQQLRQTRARAGVIYADF